MLEEQIIPRLLARLGSPATIRLKRYHGYGLGESHVDQLLQGIEELDPTGGVKLGFRAHYPQIETKLTIRGTDPDDVAAKLAPIDAEIRDRLGNFIIAEDDQTLEGVVNDALAQAGGRLAVVETFTSGHIAMRLAHLPRAEAVFRRGTVARDRAQVFEALGLPPHLDIGEYTEAIAAEVAAAAREQSGASHALAVLIDLDEGQDRMDLGGTCWIAVGREGDTIVRRARILGGREWIRLGAVEMGLDCLRRYLQGLPVIERTDFERR
jgi:nicotinamide-nucleotide amidase